MSVFTRFKTLVRGFIGLFITTVEQQNPEALLDAAKQDFLAKLAQYNQALVQLAAAAALNGVTFRAGDTGDSLRNIQEILDRRYERAAGKARVTADLIDSGHIAEQETERKALEQQALAGFLTERGL